MIRTEADINDLISNQIEESIHLDFKRGDALVNNRDCKKEIAKDVSSFANSDGGVIVYGVEEANHVASEIVPVNGNIFSKEWIEQVINSNIKRRIQGIEIIPIRIGGDIARTVYVVDIPRSLEAPHMTNEKRYYKRFNFESVQMEEYEVRDIYSRVNASVLEIGEIGVSLGYSKWSSKTSNTPNFLISQEVEIVFWVNNIGGSIEHHSKLEILTQMHFFSIDASSNEINKYQVDVEGVNRRFSIPITNSIFPNEKYRVVKAVFRILKSEDFETLKNQTISLKLYYSNGVKESTVRIEDLLSDSGVNLDELFIE